MDINLLVAARDDLKQLIEHKLGICYKRQGLTMRVKGKHQWVPRGDSLAAVGVVAGSVIFLKIKTMPKASDL